MKFTSQLKYIVKNNFCRETQRVQRVCFRKFVLDGNSLDNQKEEPEFYIDNDVIDEPHFFNNMLSRASIHVKNESSSTDAFQNGNFPRLS